MAVGDVEERGNCRRGSVRSVDVAVVVNVVAVVNRRCGRRGRRHGGNPVVWS